jgi:hypothetical protein
MNYADHTRRELLFTNRVLRFDVRYWARREKYSIVPKDETELALLLIQAESHAFLRGIKSSVRENNLRVAGSSLRSLLESTANAYWIVTDKTGKRAKKYVAITDNYSDYLDNLEPNQMARIPKTASEWTSSSAEDRLKAFSPQALMVWDYCSAFTHPSPTYMSLHRGAPKVLNYVIGQANTYAVTNRYIMLDSPSLFNGTEAKLLNVFAQELLKDKLPQNLGVSAP